MLVYPVSDQKVTSIVGQGWAPKGASIDYYTTRGKLKELLEQARRLGVQDDKVS